MASLFRNALRIEGDEGALESFRRRAQGPNCEGQKRLLTFHSFVPCPKKEAKALAKGLPFHSRGLGGSQSAPDPRWCRRAWGSEGDALKPQLTREEKALVYRFLTKGAPPLGAVQAMSRAYPALAFRLEYEAVVGGLTGQALFLQGEEKG